MKKYLEPSIDLLYLANEDVLTGSNEPGNELNDPTGEDQDW